MGGGYQEFRLWIRCRLQFELKLQNLGIGVSDLVFPNP